MISFPGKCCRAWNNLPPLVTQKRVYELQSSFDESNHAGQLVEAPQLAIVYFQMIHRKTNDVPLGMVTHRNASSKSQ
jgi:hypothetical protein